jgi:predicted metal-dependent phosphoesterase TrpH
MRIDFHIHTKYSSDSLIEPKKLMAKANQLSIIPTIADHNSISGHREMRELGFPFIPAEEIFTDKGDLIGLYVNELIPKGTVFLEAIDKIHEQGGLAYLPHMFDHGRSGRHTNEKEARKVDIVEVFNARCLNPKFNDLAEKFAAENKMLKAVGSDSHFLFEFGQTYVEFSREFDLNDPKALLKVLPKAKLVKKKGPFYARGTTTLVSMGKKIFNKKP